MITQEFGDEKFISKSQTWVNETQGRNALRFEVKDNLRWKINVWEQNLPPQNVPLAWEVILSWLFLRNKRLRKSFYLLKCLKNLDKRACSKRANHTCEVDREELHKITCSNFFLCFIVSAWPSKDFFTKHLLFSSSWELLSFLPFFFCSPRPLTPSRSFSQEWHL